MIFKNMERMTKFDPRLWHGTKLKRRHVWGYRQAAPENKKTPWWNRPTFWRRHPEPFSKTWRGKERRAERRFILNQNGVRA